MTLTPANLLEEMLRRAQAVQGQAIQQPRQYITPGMQGFQMSPGGAPEIPNPPSIAGTGQMQRDPQVAGPSTPLPPPSQAVQQGLSFGPQTNQGTPPRMSSPMIKQKPRASQDPRRRRRKKQFGGE